MKKLAIFFILVIIIVSTVFVLYINFKANYNTFKKENSEFEKYLEKEIYGSDLATIINRAINNNEKNKVSKNNKGEYLNDDKTSLNIEIKMIDDNSIYSMEKIYHGGIQQFVNYYNDIKFKCIEIQYHKSTNKIKYMLFEQITQ